MLTAPTSYIASSKTCYSRWLLSSSRTRIYIGTLFCKGIPIMPSTIATYILPQFECIPWLWSVIVCLMCWLSTYRTRLQVWPDLIFVWGPSYRANWAVWVYSLWVSDQLQWLSDLWMACRIWLCFHLLLIYWLSRVLLRDLFECSNWVIDYLPGVKYECLIRLYMRF